DQIQIFQSLPPDQQQAILESLGRGSASSASMPEAFPDRALDFPELVRRTGRNGQDRAALAGMMGVEQDPRLKAEDTLLLSVEIREFKGPALTPAVQLPPSIRPGTAGTTPANAATVPPAPASREKIVRTEEEL